MLHVGYTGAAKSVDRLVVVADREDRGILTGEEPEPAVLQRVGVLEFVYEQVREAALIMLAQHVVVGQKLEGP